MASRYIIGIDLGTSTTSLSYLDTLKDTLEPQTLPIAQWEDKDNFIKKDILPSFCFLPHKKDVRNKSFKLPFYEEDPILSESKLALGRLALGKQTDEPSRVISSAKSWLCHAGVNREDKILPWNSDDITGDHRHSPVEVLSYLLLHLRLYWNHTIGKHNDDYKLENQSVVITVPASFDEIATALTLKAAKKAGFNEKNTSLVEEPQAAFYLWIHENKKSKLLKELKDQKTVLVCDIGGGTSDFSLFSLKTRKEKGLHIERTKISRHILLGGDNLDLKIASLFEEEYQKKYKKSLSSKQWAFVSSSSRAIKESIFSSPKLDGENKKNDLVHLSIPSDKPSSNLFKNTEALSINKQDLKEELLNSFFPDCSKNKISEDTLSKSSLSDFSLPFAKDPAFSHHLAEFLDGQKVDSILFVGGTLIPKFLQKKLKDIIATWQKKEPIQLNDFVQSSTVSKGAAIFGLSQRFPEKLRIISGYPRNLYLEIQKDQEKLLLCLVPKGLQEKKFVLSSGDLDLSLSVNKDIILSLYSSSSRANDKRGDLIPLRSDSFKQLAPIQTKIKAPKKKKQTSVKVYLESGLTETGLLKIYCCQKNSDEKWEFSFNVRDNKLSHNNGNSLSSEENSQNKEVTHLEKSKELLYQFYGKSKDKFSKAAKPKASKIIADLETLFGAEKREWSLTTLRSLASILIETKTSRGRSPAHEAAWYNLCGYFMRPGYGNTLDSSMVSELESLFDEGPRHHEMSQVQNEWWVFWRRISGGLSKEQQGKIFSKVFPKIRSLEASPEMIMILGALELVDTNKKTLLLNKLSEDITKIGSSFLEQKFWSLTHLSSRNLLYSGPENIIRPNFLESSYKKLSELPSKTKSKHKEALIRFYLHSGRKIGDREFDLSEKLKEKALKELSLLASDHSLADPLREVIELKNDEKKELLGDSLPCGLSLS